jgi:uncharacterized SAM-dependent methyltransferase
MHIIFINLLVKKDYDKKNFNYDCIFPINSQQSDMYEKAAKSVVEVSIKIDVLNIVSFKGI